MTINEFAMLAKSLGAISVRPRTGEALFTSYEDALSARDLIKDLHPRALMDVERERYPSEMIVLAIRTKPGRAGTPEGEYPPRRYLTNPEL